MIALWCCQSAAEELALQAGDVSQFAAGAFGVLSIVGAQNVDLRLAWAAWDTGTGGARVAHLALIRRGADKRAAVWTQAWQESYQPSRTVLGGWRYLGGPVLALTLQQGAAAESLLLFGVDQKGRVASLGRWDAAQIAFSLLDLGTVVLINDPGSRPARECLAWNQQAGRADDVTCPPR